MPGTIEQRSLMLIMIFIGSCLHVHHKPYAHAFNNGLQALIYFLVFMLIVAGHALQIVPDHPVIDLLLTVLFLSCIALPISFELGLGKRMDSKLRKISRFLIALRTKATRLLDACLGSSTLDTEMQAQPAETAAAPSSDPLNA